MAKRVQRNAVWKRVCNVNATNVVIIIVVVIVIIVVVCVVVDVVFIDCVDVDFATTASSSSSTLQSTTTNEQCTIIDERRLITINDVNVPIRANSSKSCRQVCVRRRESRRKGARVLVAALRVRGGPVRSESRAVLLSVRSQRRRARAGASGDDVCTAGVGDHARAQQERRRV